MKRKFIVYIFILTALIVGYIAITKLPQKVVKEETTEYNLLEGFLIKSVEVENAYGRYKLTYNNADWLIDGTKVESEYISCLLRMTGNLKLQSTDLKAFGLENPAAVVTLTDDKGVVKTLLIGDLVSDKIGRYVMMDDIYVVSNQYISWLLEDKVIFKNRVLYSETTPQKVEFNGMCFEIVDGVWQMTAPYNHTVRGTELNKEVLENLYFEAVDFTDKSKSECGLDTPKGYISVWNSNNEKTTIYFGDKSDGLIYAKREDSEDICRIEIPSFLDKKPIYFLNTLCYVKNIDEIDSIDVSEIHFDITKDTYKKDGKVIEKRNFIEFYKKLMGMTLVDEATNPKKDKIIFKMKVNFKNGTNDVVEVYEYKERYGAVFINGICTFYTMKESAEEILAQAKKL